MARGGTVWQVPLWGFLFVLIQHFPQTPPLLHAKCVADEETKAQEEGSIIG